MLGTYSSCKTVGLTIEDLLIAFLCEFLSSTRILVELEFVRQGFVALDFAKLSSQVAATHENLHKIVLKIVLKMVLKIVLLHLILQNFPARFLQHMRIYTKLF